MTVRTTGGEPSVVLVMSATLSVRTELYSVPFILIHPKILLLHELSTLAPRCPRPALVLGLAPLSHRAIQNARCVGIDTFLDESG